MLLSPLTKLQSLRQSGSGSRGTRRGSTQAGDDDDSADELDEATGQQHEHEDGADHESWPDRRGSEEHADPHEEHADHEHYYEEDEYDEEDHDDEEYDE